MAKTKILLVSTLGLSLLVLCVIPVKTAYTRDISFIANTRQVTDRAIWLRCGGPFLRSSLCSPVFGGLMAFEFYSAEDNELSPYGDWVCSVYTAASFPLCVFAAAEVIFCLTDEEPPDDKVNITVEQGESFDGSFFTITTNFPQGRCFFRTTNSFLGDRPQQFKPDRDTFSFKDTEGDEVTLRLEEDGSVGHTGAEARLRLRGPIGSASVDEFRRGVLPLEIKAMIPMTGKYEIVVDQKSIPDDLRYRGGYKITLDSSLSDVEEIDPGRDVE